MNEITAPEQFLTHVNESLHNGRFIKLTLSKKGNKTSSLKNTYTRLIMLKGKTVFSMQFRYDTKDEVKNFPIIEATTQVKKYLGSDLLNADLFTQDADLSLQYNKKRKARLFVKKASMQVSDTIEQHDKAKKRLIQTEKNLYLTEMGITNQNGILLKNGQRKFKQINKYIEIIDALIRQKELPSNAHIVDMGSGKGYLTFALYDYLRHKRGLNIKITGIELRPKLVDFCNELAAKCGFEGLCFISKDIHDYQPERIDMLIALHACDIATDIAIAKGIQSNSSIIVVAPCCHKQLRKAMQHSNELSPILKHGILEERQAELLTDGIRALLLEAYGYSTKVFEFISSEHTSKNLMITASRSKPRLEALEHVQKIKKDFGIEFHYLERLLSQ